MRRKNANARYRFSGVFNGKSASPTRICACARFDSSKAHLAYSLSARHLRRGRRRGLRCGRVARLQADWRQRHRRCHEYWRVAEVRELRKLLFAVSNRALYFSPDVVSYLSKLEEEKRARQHGAAQDNRSFIAKYVSHKSHFPIHDAFNAQFQWMYIVPVVIIMMFSSMTQEQTQE